MIKVISTGKYRSLLNDRKLLKLHLYGGYDNMTYTELCKLRKERISELREVDKKIKEIGMSIGVNTAGGGNYKP